MGDQAVSKFSDPVEKRNFTRHLLNDIKALEIMLEQQMFEEGIQRIGAEQELCLVGNDWRPSMSAMQILEALRDHHFTTEIAQYNLEINLDPLEFKGNCFSKMEKKLTALLAKVNKVAEKKGSRVIMTGILPTIQRKELNFEYMTPNPRYEALNDVIKSQRGGNFELNIVGIDELITQHENVLFEACNTSFQVHLQVDARDFTEYYNWAQVIAGPVLSVMVNSPLLMGKRLWKETRIALFQQSIDTRNSSSMQRDMEARVSFGKNWLKGSVAELFKDNISRYPMLFSSYIKENSLDVLDDGKIPQLNALKLHNGTVYKWNRACYGISEGKPHLRIENRYIPSGPTPIDEIANAAFWLGLMKGMPEKYRDLPSMMSFEDARYNFYNAARTGLDISFRWFGKSITSKNLLKKELLPITEEGLKKMKVDPEDIRRYLGVIEARVKKEVTGAKWMVQNFTRFLVRSTPNEASRNLTKKMYELQGTNKPVHQWEHVNPDNIDEHKEFDQVNQVMTTDLVTVKEDDYIDLVINLMDWNAIHHVPVENEKHELVGMITSNTIIRYLTGSGKKDDVSVKDLMETTVLSVDPHCTTKDAVNLMAEHRVTVLPVLSGKKLIGIMTESDIIQVAKMTGKF